MYTFEIDPIAKARPRFSRKGRVYTKKETKDYENAIFYSAQTQHVGDLLEGPLDVEVIFYMRKPKTVKRKYPSVKPDVDNLIKALFDALNKSVWQDDAQVVNLRTSKQYSPSGRITVKIKGMK